MAGNDRSGCRRRGGARLDVADAPPAGRSCIEGTSIYGQDPTVSCELINGLLMETGRWGKPLLNLDELSLIRND